MDTEIINQHLKWIKSIESEYRYVEQESGEFDAFFEVAGNVSGATVGMAVGGWAASGVLAAVLSKAGSMIDEKLGL
jgi:hypothetical protein